jgi:hypothetical protein
MFGDAGQRLLSVNNNLPAARRSYDVTRSELRGAIASRSILARGFRKGSQKSFAREDLPADAFDRFPSLTVDAFGETSFKRPPTSPTDIPQWDGIVFYEEEIRALWHKPTPDLDEWMRAAAAARPDDKRDTLIGDCRSETACTVRQAQKAHGRLPPELKRARGERIKPHNGLK